MIKRASKIIVSVLLTLAFIGLGVLFVYNDFDLSAFKISSIDTIFQEHESLEQANQKLEAQKAVYTSTLQKLQNEQDNFKKEKSKYDSISEDTVNVIKEATTIEHYNIEYMWIKLGNYARKNNLLLVIQEPTTSTMDNNLTAPTADTGLTAPTGTAGTTTEGTGETSTISTADGQDNTSNTSTSDTSLFKIEVTGSYVDLCSFIFEVENDKELRFKLDNIKMNPESENVIRTTFDVKNMIILK